MRPADEIQAVQVVELLRHPGAEQIARPAGADEPRVSDVLGVRPHHVAERSLVRDLPVTLDGPDLASTAE